MSRRSGSSSSSSSSKNADIEQMLAPGMKRGEEGKKKIKNRSEEAYKWVSQFTKPVDVKTMMKTQRPLVNTSAGTITDMITLVDMPMTDFVQFKECGSIVSKEHLRTISEKIDFESSPKLWGFRSPMGVGDLDGCIYGELCNYNHAADPTDPESSFPQAPGYLNCKVVQASVLAKQNDKEVTKRWISITFCADKKGKNPYRNRDFSLATSYLPLTEEGVMVFMWVKQCFASRNYYGMTQIGQVKYGRVHKKTRVNGGGVDHGYPDATMAGRHGGDMHKFGITPYVCQDMVKTWCTGRWYKFYKNYRYVPEEAFDPKISAYRHIDDSDIWESIVKTPIWADQKSDKFYTIDGATTRQAGIPSPVWDGSTMGKVKITKDVLTIAADTWCHYKKVRITHPITKRLRIDLPNTMKKQQMIDALVSLRVTQQHMAACSLAVVHKLSVSPIKHWSGSGGIDPSLYSFQLLIEQNRTSTISPAYREYYFQRVPVVFKPSFSGLHLRPRVNDWKLDPEAIQRFQTKIMLDNSARVFRGFSVLHETYRNALVPYLKEAVRLYPLATLMSVGQHSPALAHSIITGGKGYVDLEGVKQRLRNTAFADFRRAGGDYVKALNSSIYYSPRMIPDGAQRTAQVPFDHYIYRGADAKSIDDIKFSSTNCFVQSIPSSWSLQALPTPFEFMTRTANVVGTWPCCLFRLKITKDVPFLMITKGKLNLIMKGLLNQGGSDLPSKRHQFECIMGACVLKVVSMDKIFVGLTAADILRFAPTLPTHQADWIEANNGFNCYTVEFVSPIRHSFDKTLMTDHVICSKGIPDALITPGHGHRPYMLGSPGKRKKNVKAKSTFGKRKKRERKENDLKKRLLR